MFQYNEKFYDSILEMKRDEKSIIPKLIEWIKPTSIVDFGCAEGLWLAEALHIDPTIIVDGYDGNYVVRERLQIPEECFHPVDLGKELKFERKYDLAISTEVAEHIDEEYAEVFVDNITKSSDRVFFTAALPEQGGTNHVNERWQSYWISKFQARGYYLDVSVRNYFWNNEDIMCWRRQNIMFFSKINENIAPFTELYDVVHPMERLALVKRERDAIFSQMLHYIMRPEIYIGLDRVLASLVTKYSKIAIYPYGLNGRLCEIIMRHKYNIEPFVLIDNNVCKFDERVVSAEELQNVNDEYAIIETAGDSEAHYQILDSIKKNLGDQATMYSTFGGEIYGKNHI